MRIVMLLAACLVFLSACGKKAPLRPPSSEPPAQEPAAAPVDDEDA